MRFMSAVYGILVTNYAYPWLLCLIFYIGDISYSNWWMLKSYVICMQIRNGVIQDRLPVISMSCLKRPKVIQRYIEKDDEDFEVQYLYD